jgi:hypothetical protein
VDAMRRWRFFLELLLEEDVSPQPMPPCRMLHTRRGGCTAMGLGRPRRTSVARVSDTLTVSPCTGANHAPSPERDVTRSKKMHGHGARGPYQWPATLYQSWQR